MTSVLQEPVGSCALCGRRMRCKRLTRATSSTPGRAETWRRHYVCPACGYEADFLVADESAGPLVGQPTISVDADDLAVPRENGEPTELAGDPFGKG
jgi:hypothetical protein